MKCSEIDNDNDIAAGKIRRMSKGDEYFFTICFTILTILLVGLRDRLKRIEVKIDKSLKQ